jgi:hypothetical protein
MRRNAARSSGFLFALAFCAGCGNEEGIFVPAYNPSGSARQALSLFDENKNGSLDGNELLNCPGLQSALPRVDQNGDGQLTSGEISDRIGYYKSRGVALTSVQCVILRNGQPVPNAKVTFVPEEFMKNTLQPATGTTDQTGRTGMKKEGLEFPGIQLGLYRVQVSLPNESGEETLPPQYNEKTTLGAEVASDVPDLERGLVFDLKAP